MERKPCLSIGIFPSHALPTMETQYWTRKPLYSMNLNYSVGFLNYLLQNSILSLAILCNNELAKLTEWVFSSKICKGIISK